MGGVSGRNRPAQTSEGRFGRTCEIGFETGAEQGAGQLVGRARYCDFPGAAVMPVASRLFHLLDDNGAHVVLRGHGRPRTRWNWGRTLTGGDKQRLKGFRKSAIAGGSRHTYLIWY